MRIKYKAHFIMGIIVILVGIACLITNIYLHRGAKITFTFIPIICGVAQIVQSIETKAERQKREEELQTIAKMCGWDKDSDAE
jgi:uncharacterized membrane protein HdeD (DUF308 family)